MPNEHLTSGTTQTQERTDDTDREVNAPDDANQHTSRNVASESLANLSLRDTVEFNWSGVDALAQRHEEQARDLVAQAFEHANYIPAVAGAIARDLAPEDAPKIDIAWPTADQIKEQEWKARAVSRGCEVVDFLTFGAFRLTERCDRWLEHKAQERIQSTAFEVTRQLKILRRYQSPQAQLLIELERMYHELTDGNGTRRMTPARLFNVFDQLRSHSASDVEGVEEPPDHYTAPAKAVWLDVKHTLDNYPLLGRIVDLTAKTAPYRHRVIELKLGARVIGPEIVQGLGQFLRAQGVKINMVDTENGHGHALHRLAERLSPRRLQQAPGQIEATLEQVYQLVPTSSKKFNDDVYHLCRNISLKAREGNDPKAIVAALLKDLRQ